MKLIVEAASLVDKHLSGIGQYCLNLSLRLCNSNDEVTLLVPRMAQVHSPSLKAYQKSIPVPQRIVNLLSFLNLPINVDILAGPGVYLFPNYKHFSLSKKSRKIVIIHDLTYLKFPETMTPRNQKFLSRIVPRALKDAGRIGVISRAVQSEIIEAYPWVDQSKFLYLPPAINPDEYYRRPSAETLEVKDSFKIKDDYFLFVSSIEPRKNLVNQLEGFAQSKASKSHSLVIVGGGGWLNDDVQAKVKQLQTKGLKIIKPSRFVLNHEVAALMSGATGLLSASLYEGFGMPIIEAQACRCPVITSKTSSMPEAAGEDGAILVDPLSPAEISSAIDQIFSDAQLRSALVSQGYINQRRFSWDESAKTLLNAAQELAREL